MDRINEKYVPAVELAIEALEKNTPKKPLVFDVIGSEEKAYVCPYCRYEWIPSKCIGLSCCFECGQRLDWSEKNENIFKN